MWRWLPLFALAEFGCGYRTCGTIEYWTSRVDDRLDENGDSYIDRIEACGDDYGSWAYFYDNGYTQLLLDSSSWDMGDAVDVAYDYLPITELVFLPEHLEVGEVMTLDHLDGYGSHKPAGDQNTPNHTYPLTAARIEVLKGPKEDNFDGENYKLKWEITFGEVTDEMPKGFQRLEGEDWINFTTWGEWDPAEHNGIQPPDAIE